MEYYGIFRRTDSGITKWAWRKAIYPNDQYALEHMKTLILKNPEGGTSQPYYIDRLMRGKKVVYNG